MTPRCCLTTPTPGRWTAGVDDTADDYMVNRMIDIRDKLSNKMPLGDFIWALQAAINIDDRTMLGHDIRTCLLSNAAHRLAILAAGIDPDRIWRARGWARLGDAWAVFRGRAVPIYVRE